MMELNTVFDLLWEFYLGSKCNKSDDISLFKKSMVRNMMMTMISRILLWSSFFI